MELCSNLSNPAIAQRLSALARDQQPCTASNALAANGVRTRRRDGAFIKSTKIVSECHVKLKLTQPAVGGTLKLEAVADLSGKSRRMS